MNGIRQGGLAGMTDAVLGSEYAQVILQILLRVGPLLKDRFDRDLAAACWPLVRAGLMVEHPMMREVAAGFFSHGPAEALPADAIDTLRPARRQAHRRDQADVEAFR